MPKVGGRVSIVWLRKTFKNSVSLSPRVEEPKQAINKPFRICPPVSACIFAYTCIVCCVLHMHKSSIQQKQFYVEARVYDRSGVPKWNIFLRENNVDFHLKKTQKTKRFCLDYVFRTSIDKIRENGFELTKRRSKRYPAKTITDADYADDLALLANTPNQAETLLHSLERAAADIGLHVNAHKTEYMCYN